MIKINSFISLLSGGLDSPVALYLMAKRGLKPICLSFLTSDDSSHSMKNKIINILQGLTLHTDYKLKVYFIDHDYSLSNYIQKCDRKLTCVLCKRLMLRIAKEIGKKEGTNLIVTGDILGEQASQTLDNLYAYNDIINDHVILRPLIGFNKEDVIKINKKLGLYDIISQKSAGCQYNPQYPETHAKKNEIFDGESKINIESLIKKALDRAIILEI
ncbi:MAG: hypothetical protein ACFFBP_09790 [Promethearchaeota archaeon]